MGRDPEAGSFLTCSACNRQVADGIPLSPESAAAPVWALRSLAGTAARLTARLLNGPPWYQYQPKPARAQFQDLHASWTSESYAREMERQRQPRRPENDLKAHAHPGEGEQIKRSRQIVLSRHAALLDGCRQYISTFLSVACGKIREDEYGDLIWDGAEREIKRIIADKIFKGEIIGPDEFYSFEFLSRCEPAFGSEYSYRWIFDELYDRLKVHRQTRQHAMAEAGDVDPDKMSGTQFEQWLIALIRQAGIADAKPTKTTGDQGADIIVRQRRTIVIQAKRCQDTVGNAAVQEVHGARTYYAADEAWVVTNSTFTRSARELATSSGVRLVDRSNLRDIGSLIIQAVASEDAPLLADLVEPCPNGRYVPGDPRPADQSSNAARETESVPEPILPLAASSCTTPPPIGALAPAPSEGPPQTCGTPQTAARFVATKPRRLIPGLFSLLLLVGATVYLLMSHYSRQRVEQKVKETLATWTSTTLSDDLAGQVECYGPAVAPFFQRPSATLQEVAAEKERIIKNYPLMKKYAISNISFEHADANSAVVSFDKSWEGRGIRIFAGSERESLELRPLGGRWRIVAERELRIYWVRTK